MRIVRSFQSLTIALFLLLTLALTSTASANNNSIADVLLSDGRFTTLQRAARQADLVDMLENNGPFTVFAPSDNAFEKLPQSTVDALFADTELLRQTLLYHFATGRFTAAQVSTQTSVNTARGLPINIEVVNGKTILNGVSQVVNRDIPASNGMIHIVNNVLLLPGSNLEGPSDGNQGGGGDCVIPESGPWPPCATGGGGGGSDPGAGSGADDCVIPESGPWPPCATGGGGGGSNPGAGSGADDCVIPESGPWPPCATGNGGSGDSNAGSDPTPPSAPTQFDTTPVKPFSSAEFRSLMGQFRDSLRSFNDDVEKKHTDLCGSYRGWHTLWTVDSPVYEVMPEQYVPLYNEWRVMLGEIVTLTESYLNACNFVDQPEPSLEEIAAVKAWLEINYPRSEEMVNELNALQ